jgi:hypothetical protein
MTMIRTKIPALLALAAATAFGAPAVALAQGQPQDAQPQGPPPQGQQMQGPGQPMQGPLPSYASGEEEIHGRISQITGKYQISVRDDRGFIDNVALHDGTVINPRGLTLQSGQAVSVLGHAAGNTFVANEVDTPYRYARFGPGPYYYGGPYGGWYGPAVYGRFYGRF